jgi:hypothetical protein
MSICPFEIGSLAEASLLFPPDRKNIQYADAVRVFMHLPFRAAQIASRPVEKSRL